MYSSMIVKTKTKLTHILSKLILDKECRKFQTLSQFMVIQVRTHNICSNRLKNEPCDLRLLGNALNIRKTCPCNEYPLKPHFYIVKLGYAQVYYFSYFWSKTYNVGRVRTTSKTHNQCFEQEIFKVLKFVQ